MNVRSGSVRVCGYSKKDALKHAVYDIDPNYEFPDTPAGRISFFFSFFYCISLYLYILSYTVVYSILITVLYYMYYYYYCYII